MVEMPGKAQETSPLQNMSRCDLHLSSGFRIHKVLRKLVDRQRGVDGCRNFCQASQVKVGMLGAWYLPFCYVVSINQSLAEDLTGRTEAHANDQ